jgi:hypothetical protein
MADRSQSPAYRALSDGGRKVLGVIEQKAGRGVVAITLEQLMDESGLCRSATRYGVRQCEVLGFVNVAMGHRRVNVSRLNDGWRRPSLRGDALRAEPGLCRRPPRPVCAAAGPRLME